MCYPFKVIAGILLLVNGFSQKQKIIAIQLGGGWKTDGQSKSVIALEYFSNTTHTYYLQTKDKYYYEGVLNFFWGSDELAFGLGINRTHRYAETRLTKIEPFRPFPPPGSRYYPPRLITRNINYWLFPIYFRFRFIEGLKNNLYIRISPLFILGGRSYVANMDGKAKEYGGEILWNFVEKMEFSLTYERSLKGNFFGFVNVYVRRCFPVEYSFKPPYQGLLTRGVGGANIGMEYRFNLKSKEK